MQHHTRNYTIQKQIQRYYSRLGHQLELWDLHHAAAVGDHHILITKPSEAIKDIIV